MKIKRLLILILCVLIFCSVLSTTSLASVTSIKTAMQGVNNPSGAGAERIIKVLNIVIGLMQIAGTGIALIVITLMGIKYLMASPGEKAEVKKQVMPIIFGCILLFGGLTLMKAIFDFAQNVLK